MNHLQVAAMFLLAFGLAGALVYRWRGSDHAYRPLSQAVFSWPYFFIVELVFAGSHGWELGLWDLPGAIVAVLTFAAVCTGHGGWQDLSTWTKPRSDERMEFLIKWAYPKLPEYWYDALGLAVNGLCITLPAGIALMNPIIALSGALKAPAYMIGWWFWRLSVKGNWSWAPKPTVIGEYLTGFFLWGSLGLAIFTIIL